NQDLGPEYVTLPQPAKTVTFTYTKTTDVKDISHYVLFYVVEATPAVPTSTPPSCDAAGTVVVPSSTDAYTYDSSEAGGVVTVTVKANAGYVLVANMGPWTFPIAQLTGEACVASNPPPATPANPATPAPTVCSAGGTVTAATPVVGSAGPLPAQAAPTQALPATGTASWALAFIAMALVLVGSGFVSFSRRFS
ncbi:MAG TPA: LPXTG cell wall anchor domain-containing protein, partial [Ilumatobacteraceae bacterium]|nr:LPXTG cell wall anchor domain-containing protein [Ilumatobacteraceae bacterium]